MKNLKSEQSYFSRAEVWAQSSFGGGGGAGGLVKIGFWRLRDARAET